MQALHVPPPPAQAQAKLDCHTIPKYWDTLSNWTALQFIKLIIFHDPNNWDIHV